MNQIEQLKNPAWHALRTLHKPLGIFSNERDADNSVARYRPEVSVFAALRNREGLGDLTTIVAIDESVALVSPEDEIPILTPAWLEVARFNVWQMICEAPQIEPIDDVGHDLGIDDAKAMYGLARLTNPGPFEMHTHLMGRYVGVYESSRHDEGLEVSTSGQGSLHAMAGERFRMPGWVEVSGVCTHPDARGQGYAAKLVAKMMRHVHGQGGSTFLHVRQGSPSEAGAIRVYEKLGFHHHQKLVVSLVQRIK